MDELREKMDGPNIETQESQGTNDKTYNKLANAPQKHISISELKIPQAIIDEYHTNQQEQSRKDRKRFCVEVATLIVISLYTAIAAYQGYKMRQATDAAKESAAAAASASKTAEGSLMEIQKQTEAMQIAADANKKTVELAERNIKATQEQFRQDQRAWMGFSETPQWQTVVNKPLIVTVFFKNMGKTPAKKVQIAAMGEIVSERESPNFALENSATRERAVLVFPQQVISHDVNVTLPHTVLDSITFNDIKNGTKRIYIHGIHTYWDIFNRHQWITFCFYLRADGSKTEMCKEHNDTGSY